MDNKYDVVDPGDFKYDEDYGWITREQALEITKLLKDMAREHLEEELESQERRDKAGQEVAADN